MSCIRIIALPVLVSGLHPFDTCLCSPKLGNRSKHLDEMLCVYVYCTVLHCTALYCTEMHCTVLYCTVLYCTVLYCTVLYYTASNIEADLLLLLLYFCFTSTVNI